MPDSWLETYAMLKVLTPVVVVGVVLLFFLWLWVEAKISDWRLKRKNNGWGDR